MIGCKRCGRCCKGTYFTTICKKEDWDLIYKYLMEKGMKFIFIHDPNEDILFDIEELDTWDKLVVSDFYFMLDDDHICPFLRQENLISKYYCELHDADVKPEVCKHFPISRKRAESFDCIYYESNIIEPLGKDMIITDEEKNRSKVNDEELLKDVIFDCDKIGKYIDILTGYYIDVIKDIIDLNSKSDIYFRLRDIKLLMGSRFEAKSDAEFYVGLKIVLYYNDIDIRLIYKNGEKIILARPIISFDEEGITEAILKTLNIKEDEYPIQEIISNIQGIVSFIDKNINKYGILRVRLNDVVREMEIDEYDRPEIAFVAIKKVLLGYGYKIDFGIREMGDIVLVISSLKRSEKGMKNRNANC